jgi:hypothetical protein
MTFSKKNNIKRFGLDDKELSLISSLRRKIKEKDFHERDILALLLLLRQYSASHSPVYELANFINHREKVQGHIKDYLYEAKKTLDDAKQKGAGRQLVFRELFTVKDVQNSFNSTFSQLDLEDLTLQDAEDVLLCIMSLLQDVRILHNDEEIGKLTLVRTKSEIQLRGNIRIQNEDFPFSPLIVPNHYCDGPRGEEPQPFSGLVEARCINGALKLCPINLKALTQKDVDWLYQWLCHEENLFTNRTAIFLTAQGLLAIATPFFYRTSQDSNLLILFFVVGIVFGFAWLLESCRGKKNIKVLCGYLKGETLFNEVADKMWKPPLGIARRTNLIIFLSVVVTIVWIILLTFLLLTRLCDAGFFVGICLNIRKYMFILANL